MTIKTDYDLIIVGASFAGLIAARTAAYRGLKTAIIDAKKEPGARVRTTGILVKEAVEEIDIPSALTRKIPGARLYAPNGRHLDLYAPGYYFLATDTPAMMRWLAQEAARAGVDLLFGTRFQDADYVGNSVALHRLGLTCKYLIGADGAKSNVANAFGLGKNTDFLVGLEAEFAPNNSVNPDLLHCFVDSRLAPGYLGWVVPGVHTTQVGVAVSNHFFGQSRKPDFQSFYNHTHRLFNFAEPPHLERRSGLIPCGGLVSSFYQPRVMLIGDAAGMVSPLTAGGIRFAFQYGRRAGQLVADYLLADGGDPGEIIAKELPKLGMKKWMRRAWSIAPPNQLLNLGLFTPPMRALAQWIYFQKRGMSANLDRTSPPLNGISVDECS